MCVCVHIFTLQWFQNELGKKKETLLELQRQNQLVERDVQRYRERQKYLQTIDHLKLKKLWVVGVVFG